MEEKEYQKNIGGLWAKTANNEKKTRYYSGSIDTKELLEQCGGELPEKIRFTCFRNFQKTEEKYPDYRILLSTYKTKEVEEEKEIVKSEPVESEADQIPF